MFSDAGAYVLVADRRPTSDDFEFCETDVSREEDVAAMFDAAQQLFGRVDILVNNAGIQPLGIGFERVTVPLLERTFAGNVHGVTFGFEARRTRVLADGGRVINIARSPA